MIMRFSALLLALLLGVSAAQSQPGLQPGTLTVTGSGTVYGQPDQAIVDLGANIADEDLTAALAEANEVIARVTEAILATGVAREDIRTAYFNIWREEPYRPDGMPGTPIYRVNNILSVTVRDTERVGEVLDAGVAAGANTVNNVQYTIANPDALASEAREAAFANARAKAEQLASLAGMTLGEVVSLSDGSSLEPGPIYPQPAAMMDMGAGGIPVTGGQLAVTASVRVTFAIGGAAE
jgi:uncharacterized protein